MKMTVLRKRSWCMLGFETWWKEDVGFRNWGLYVGALRGEIFSLPFAFIMNEWSELWSRDKSFGLLFMKVWGVGFPYRLVMMEWEQNLVSKLRSAVLVFSMSCFSSAYTDTHGKITIPVSLALQLLSPLPCVSPVRTAIHQSNCQMF